MNNFNQLLKTLLVQYDNLCPSRTKVDFIANEISVKLKLKKQFVVNKIKDKIMKDAKKEKPIRYSVLIDTFTYVSTPFEYTKQKEALDKARDIRKFGTLSYPLKELWEDDAIISVYDNEKRQTIYSKKIRKGVKK